MNLLAWFLEGSLHLRAFQDSAKVCIEHFMHGKVAVILEGGSFAPSATRTTSVCGKHFQSKCRNVPRAHQEQVSACSLCLF